MWLNKWFSAMMVAVMCVTCVTPAFADVNLKYDAIPELQPGEPSVGEAISPMKKGQKAPFTGVLLSPAAVIKIVVDINNIPETIALERKDATKKCETSCTFRLEWSKIELGTDKKILKANLDAEKKQNAILVGRIEKLEKKQPNIPLWTASGAVAGIVTTVLIVFAVSKAENAAK